MSQLVGEKGKSTAARIYRSPVACAPRPRNPIWIALQSAIARVVYATARWLIITLNIPAKKHGGATAEDVDTSTLLLHQGSTLIGEAMPLGSPCSRGLLGSSTALVVYLELNLTHI
ncbi:hypothetical protein OIU77_023539 [Salix suchowensis]|uniref:Uncharacterized protein n=1 Tax=Salix suchowensis TaxID=1278906 RepID=A0ABQ9C689_9ROSI|nr:hypothetical protein OIU78_010346 [Salix suchowensis]KAJ6394335.1 hypothetical protein OIU77_023539 [Salix suchowensis]